MSTRARIAVALPNGQFTSVYVHKDGYPEGVGRVLVQYYSAPGQVKALLALGDLSRLCPQLAPPEGQLHDFGSPLPGVTLAYQRDRGDMSTEAVTSIDFVTLAALAQQCNAEYIYVFIRGQWSMAPLAWANGVRLPEPEGLQQVAA